MAIDAPKTRSLTYSKMATAGDTPPIPVPQKGVRPGSTLCVDASASRAIASARRPSLQRRRAADSTLYKGAVVDAVKHFQHRHGLDSDGVLGKGTVTDLNVPLKDPRAAASTHAGTIPLDTAGLPRAANYRQHSGISAAYAAPPTGQLPDDESSRRQGDAYADAGVR